MPDGLLWIFVTLVTRWALITVWLDYVEPWLVRRSHARAAQDRAEEREERRFFGSGPSAQEIALAHIEARNENTARRMAALRSRPMPR